MCPICVLTSIVYGLTWILGLFGLTKFVNYLRMRYHLWSGTKCNKCKENCDK